MTRTQYIQQWKNTLAAIERKYIKSVVLALRDQMNGVVSDLRTGGVEYAQRRLSSLQFDGRMSQEIQIMHREVGVMLAIKTQRELRKTPIKAKATTDDFISFLTEFFRLYNLQSVTQISDTTRAHIVRILEEGTQKGWGVDEMAKRINDQEYMSHRAAVITRTETVRAANFGVQKGAEAYEYEVVKEWVAIRDDRTRHSHRSINGEQRELSEPFSNGLRFPGDPEGAAKEVVNCRCTEVIIPKRDSNGLLIPKINAFNPRPLAGAA